MSKTTRILLTFTIGCALFVALPLLAWGPDDASGFFGESARFGYIAAAIVLNAFAAIRHPEVGKPAKTARTTVRRQHLTVSLLQVLSVLIVLVGPICDRHRLWILGDGQVVRYAGLGLYVVGFLTMHYAQLSLGSRFSLEVSVQEGHTLVTTGLYRYLRHPRYLGIMAFSIGLSFVFRSWPAFIAAMAAVLVLLWRIHDEEALMSAEFGAVWQNYCDKSWRLVPFIF